MILSGKINLLIALVAIALYAKQGYTIIGISNQGGLAAGHKSLEDAIAEMMYAFELHPQATSATTFIFNAAA